MPAYEFYCPSCSRNFSTQRGIAQRDEPITCPHCGGHQSKRLLAVPVIFSSSPGGASKHLGGSSCSGCNASHCSGCSSKSH